jgi:hypothetical protein
MRRPNGRQHHLPVEARPRVGRRVGRGDRRLLAKADAAVAAGRAAARRVAKDPLGAGGDRNRLGPLGRRQQSVRDQGRLVVDRAESRRRDARISERRARPNHRFLPRLSEAPRPRFRISSRWSPTIPRYRGALGSGDNAVAYAQGLLAGGWATDIDYAHKLQSVARASSVPGRGIAPRSGVRNRARPLPPPTGPGQPVSLLPANFAVASQ